MSREHKRNGGTITAAALRGAAAIGVIVGLALILFLAVGLTARATLPGQPPTQAAVGVEPAQAGPVACSDGPADIVSLGRFGGWLSGAEPGAGPAQDYLYLLEGTGLSAINVADRSHPTPEGRTDLAHEFGQVTLGPAGSALVYATNSDGLHAFDIATPNEPRLLHSMALPEPARRLAISDSLAAVLAGSYGSTGHLYLVDISRPATPTVTGMFTTSGRSNGVALLGNLALVSDPTFGLLIVDISRPAAPVQVGSYVPPSSATGVAVAGRRVFLGDQDNRITILDVTDPAHPAKLGEYRAAQYVRTFRPTADGAMLVIALGQYGIVFVDVRNPAAPTPYSGPAAASPAVVWSWPAYGLAVQGHTLYVLAGYDGLRVLDFANPAAPVEIGKYERPEGGNQVLADGPYRYILDWDRLWVMNNGGGYRPFVPQPLSYARLASGGSFDSRMTFSGALIAVAEANAGMELFDVSNPFNLTKIAGYRPANAAAKDVAFTGRHLLVTEYVANAGWLHVLDISDPFSPTQVSALRTGGAATRVVAGTGSAVTGQAAATQTTVAYVADGADGVRVVDVTDPLGPTLITTLLPVTPSLKAEAALVFAGRLYVGYNAYSGGSTRNGYVLQAYNLADPRHPAETRRFLGGRGSVYDIAASGEMLYLAVLGGSLQMVQADAMSDGGSYHTSSDHTVSVAVPPEITMSDPPLLGESSMGIDIVWPPRPPCAGVPEHCMPWPPGCPDLPNWTLTGKKNFYLARGMMQVDKWGTFGESGMTTIEACTTVRNGHVCADDAVVCYYQRSGEPQIEVTSTLPPPVTDLGDAPDSANFSGATMTAYSGVTAHYRTVYDAGGWPYGPLHRNPALAVGILGASITAEGKADRGWDADGVNNLNPPANRADQDGGDDGLALPLAYPLNHCQPGRLQLSVKLPEGLSIQPILNIWADWSRDGDWEDALDCGATGTAREWVVQNMSLRLTQSGWHTIEVPVLPYHPAQDAAVWLRVTLSDRHAPNAAGAGPDSSYTFGETEDYYLTDFAAWRTPVLAPGQTGEQTFQGAGQFSYYDPYDPAQTGVVSVYPAGTAAAAAQARAAAPVEVLITAAGFTPQFVDITAGQTVRWRNTTGRAHGAVGGSNVGVEPLPTGGPRYLPLVLK
jgi:hypothetical protein